MSKVKIIDKKSEKSIISEKELLSKLKHPFIINMTCAFQDYENLYLLLDFLSGGDLRFHYNSDYIFKENEIKFFIACIILSLEYIHSNDIIHRDIKPENLVFDNKGYLCLTDFGIAKVSKNKNISDTSGTPGYMAPEVMNYQNHSFTADYYAIGVICYEMMMGVRPYTGENKNIIKEKILAKQVMIKNHEIPNGWTKESADFINNLIQRKPNVRLGYKGIYQIKQHNWFVDFDWKELYNMKMEAPFIPLEENNYDINYCSQEDIINDNERKKLDKIKSTNEYINGFKNYLYFNLYDKKNQKIEFINPHKIYEEIKEIKKDTNKENENNINLEKYKKLKIPELSPECKEIMKHNLFGTNNCGVKLKA